MCRFVGLTPGPGVKRLRTFRIDGERAWSEEQMELRPRENRLVDVRDEFTCQVYCPADSVTLVVLDNQE